MAKNQESMFIESEYSLEELEQFRDENGFIDLTRMGIKFSKESRETKGTAERIKNWINFRGTKALIRGNVVDNFGIYAELIVEELAKQAGIEAAHYDIVKMLDSDGKMVYGVLSVAMLDLEHDNLLSLHDLIGDEPKEARDVLEEIDYIETTKYEFTIRKLKERLENSGFTKDQIDKLLIEYQKRLVFALRMIDSDKHPENISFISDREGNLRMSPCYDNEFSLLLQRDRESLQYFYDMEEIGMECDIEFPKIGTIVDPEDGGHGSMWKDTLEMLLEEDEIFEFYYHLKETMDIETAFRTIEERIHAKLPLLVKQVARTAFEERGKEMAIIMGEGLEIEEEKSQESGVEFLMSIINAGKTRNVRTAEQVQVR